MQASLPKEDVETIILEDYGHMDYIWGMNAKTDVNDKIINFLE